MVNEKLHLKDYFPTLGENGADPIVETYLPYNSKEMNRQDQKRPCMIICPGGAYRFCSERESEPIALNFLSEGYNVFVITYSVTQSHRFPTQLLEVAALMELIYKNTDSWHCDTGRVVICGFSAGGHLAAHYSTMFDCKEVREIFPESKAVNGSILCYPVISADPDYGHMESFTNLSGIPADERTQEIMDFFSCDKNVKATTPPAFLWHTASDTCVPVANSMLYASALNKFSIPFEMHIYPLGEHGASTCDKQTHNDPSPAISHANAWIESAKKWLKLMNFSD